MATQQTTLARPTAGGLWRALSRAYARVESTERGYVYLSKLGPAYLFGLIAVLKAWALVGMTAGVIAAGGADRATWMKLGYFGSGVLFFGLVATMYVLRKRPIRRVANSLEGSVALLGSYIMLPVAFSPTVLIDEWVWMTANLLLTVGTAGAALALASLGRCFGIFPEARGLVTHGLYRFVRHPMYLFEFAAFLGVLLPVLTPINALLYGVFAAMQLARMVFEEQALASSFPDAYPAYARRTARLIPGLY